MRQFDKGPHQRFERRRIVIDAAQQHRLAHQRKARIGEPGARGPRRRREFARMIGVDRNPGGRPVDPQCRDHFGADPLRIGDRHAGMDADDLDVIDGGKIAP